MSCVIALRREQLRIVIRRIITARRQRLRNIVVAKAQGSEWRPEMTHLRVRKAVPIDQKQGAVNRAPTRKSNISSSEWGFGNEIANFSAESALHFPNLIATI